MAKFEMAALWIAVDITYRDSCRITRPCSIEFDTSSETMNIKFSTWHLHDSEEVLTVWIPLLEELRKLTGGSVNYTLFDSAALGSGPKRYDIVP
jgi:hypothetical protein